MVTRLIVMIILWCIQTSNHVYNHQIICILVSVHLKLIRYMSIIAQLKRKERQKKRNNQGILYLPYVGQPAFNSVSDDYFNRN